ncbi:hypothetical protein AOH207_14940 [Helicobacter pylori]
MARKGILKRGCWRWSLTLIKDIPNDTNFNEKYEKIDDLLFYLSYSSKVWNFLHTLDEKSITLIVDDNKKLEIEITPKMRGLLEKMRRLNALNDNAFLPLLLSLLTI